MSFRFFIPDLNKALADIDKYSARMKSEIDLELSATAEMIVTDAKTLAPADDGQLHNRIEVIRNESFDKEIESGAEYSAFVEFGTGTNVDIPSAPPGLQEYALQFKGQGLQGKHPVKFKDGTWRMVPYQLNLPARPFFFPAYQANTVELPKRIAAILEDKA